MLPQVNPTPNAQSMAREGWDICLSPYKSHNNKGIHEHPVLPYSFILVGNFSGVDFKDIRTFLIII